MRKQQDPKPTIGWSRWSRVIISLLGAVLLGALGSGLWDAIAKPSLSASGRMILTLSTLGIERVRDAAYSSAALNPSPVPPLVFLVLAGWVPFWILAVFAGFKIGSWYRKGDRREGEEAAQDRDRVVRRLRSASVVALLALSVISMTASRVVNQSVLIWRIFNANLAICAPHLGTEKEIQLKARFAAIKKRSEYLELARELERIATEAGVKLRDESLW